MLSKYHTLTNLICCPKNAHKRLLRGRTGVSALRPEPAGTVSLSGPHCARLARARYSIHRHPQSAGMPRGPSHFPGQGTGPRVPRRHPEKPLTHMSLQSPVPKPQHLTFLFLEICTAILPPCTAERKGSSSWAELGIKGAERRRRTARRRRLWPLMGNVVFMLREALRGEE